MTTNNNIEAEAVVANPVIEAEVLAEGWLSMEVDYCRS